LTDPRRKDATAIATATNSSVKRCSYWRVHRQP